MILRKRGSGSGKVAVDMTPMIDIVFQLMIFFMLTLRIQADEGDFTIHMPLEGAIVEPVAEAPLAPEIRVRLVAHADGSLAQLQLGRRDLGNDDRAFAELNREILHIIGRPGNPLTRDTEVVIDADFELDYEYVVQAITACTGRRDANSKQVVRYVEKIRFAAPRPPKAG